MRIRLTYRFSIPPQRELYKLKINYLYTLQLFLPVVISQLDHLTSMYQQPVQ
jgi:hypothetical protein